MLTPVWIAEVAAVVIASEEIRGLVTAFPEVESSTRFRASFGSARHDGPSHPLCTTFCEISLPGLACTTEAGDGRSGARHCAMVEVTAMVIPRLRGVCYLKGSRE